MKKSKTILTISCAPNRDSNSATLLNEFARGAAEMGVKIEHVHLYDLHLPYFDYKNRTAEPPESDENRDIRKIEQLIMSANALVIASPVWNFSVPAKLKNLLDRLSYIGRVYKHPYSMKKQPNLTHLHCFYIFTTGVPWYGWPLDALAYLHTKFTLWYFGGKNHGLLKAHGCGNGSKNLVKNRPRLMQKAYRKGKCFAKRYLIN